MLAISSLSKAARAATAKTPAALISTSANIELHLPDSMAQAFHNNFREAFAARSLKRVSSKGDEPITPVSPLKNVNEMFQAVPMDEQDAAVQKNARDDLFKHFRMSAASRAMKRGDGVMTEYYSLIRDDQRGQYQDDDDLIAMYANTPSLIDIATGRKAREDMYHHFWKSHEARMDADNDKESSLLATSAHDGQHQHEHRFKLPTTLNEAYLEFGSYRSKDIIHQPRPMAITETQPPFRIVDVNKEWTALCGYSRDQAVGSTLKDLLQGAKTNLDVAKDLTASLLQSDANAEYEAVLINYRYDGRSFKNHARVGRLINELGETTHFVGVFKKLSHDDELSSANCDCKRTMGIE